ncbi:MAG: cation diffusion facilitator family transporter [Acidimicrobiia bacterium]|nr:cation diffusion facilitator family transporter [Acidimicrobiia bacterium]
MSGHSSRRAVVAALIANGGIAVAKFVGFFVTGSSAMLAEGVHSVADTGNQGLLLLGDHRAKRAATRAHPFGYGRERYFWAFVVSMLLFALGGLFALFEGVEKLRHPHPLDSAAVAVVILVVSIVLEGFSFRTAIREATGLRGGQGWFTFVRRSKNPEITVVLLEDLGALIGLVFALTGVGLEILTGNPLWDALGTIAIGSLLLVISIMLAVEMKSLLIGEAASEIDVAAIESAVRDSPSVRKLIHLRTQHLAPDDILVAAKVELDGVLDFAGVASAIDVIETRVRAAVPASRLVFVEPAVFNEEATS